MLVLAILAAGIGAFFLGRLVGLHRDRLPTFLARAERILHAVAIACAALLALSVVIDVKIPAASRLACSALFLVVNIWVISRLREREDLPAKELRTYTRLAEATFAALAISAAFGAFLVVLDAMTPTAPKRPEKPRVMIDSATGCKYLRYQDGFSTPLFKNGGLVCPDKDSSRTPPVAPGDSTKDSAISAAPGAPKTR